MHQKNTGVLPKTGILGAAHSHQWNLIRQLFFIYHCQTSQKHRRIYHRNGSFRTKEHLQSKHQWTCKSQACKINMPNDDQNSSTLLCGNSRPLRHPSTLLPHEYHGLSASQLRIHGGPPAAAGKWLEWSRNSIFHHYPRIPLRSQPGRVDNYGEGDFHVFKSSRRMLSLAFIGNFSV